jgi:hypothetical protein
VTEGARPAAPERRAIALRRVLDHEEVVPAREVVDRVVVCEEIDADELPERIACGNGHDYPAEWPDELGPRATEIMALVGTLCPTCIRWRAKAAEPGASKANSLVAHVTFDRDRAKNLGPAPQAPPPPASRPSGRESRLERALATAKTEAFDFTGA